MGNLESPWSMRRNEVGNLESPWSVRRKEVGGAGTSKLRLAQDALVRPSSQLRLGGEMSLRNIPRHYNIGMWRCYNTGKWRRYNIGMWRRGHCLGRRRLEGLDASVITTTTSVMSEKNETAGMSGRVKVETRMGEVCGLDNNTRIHKNRSDLGFLDMEDVKVRDDDGILDLFGENDGALSKFGGDPKTAAAFGGGSEVSGGRRLRHRRRQQLPTVVRPMSLHELLRKAVSEKQSLPNLICDAADSFVTAFLTPLSKLKETTHPAAVLRGICAPVAETPPTECHVVSGRVPADLAGGAYLRNGPNASSIHYGDGYHLFDGDGMIHAVTLKRENQRPIYCSRFVETNRFRQEKRAGRPLFSKFFGGSLGVAGAARSAVSALRLLFGILDLGDGCGLSNTSVCFFNGHILSLSEDDLPYVIRVSPDSGEISTVRRFVLPFKTNMCAHPKLDPVTGDMYAFNLNMPLLLAASFSGMFLPAPFSVFRLSAADGSKSADMPVSLVDVPMVHDFAITERFVVFPDSQLVIRPWEMARGGIPLVSDAGKTPRLGLLPRTAAAAEMWFETPGINCMHYLNAWEEEGGGREEVVVVASILTPPDQVLEMNASSRLSEIRLDMKTGRARCRKLGVDYDLEFGVINPSYVGKRSRYAYLAAGSFPRLTGVVKVDLSGEAAESAVVAERHWAAEGSYGGEPFFVPAKDALTEDHGYLLCLVGDEKRDVSELLIMDAQSPSLQIIAAVELPSRVPVGFHGCFLTAEQLAQQKHRS